MILSFSSWQGHGKQKFLLMGETYPAPSNTSQKREAQQVHASLAKWGALAKAETGKKLVFIGENGGSTTQSVFSHVLEGQEDKDQRVDSVQTSMVDTAIWRRVADLTVRMQTFWKHLGQSPTTEEDDQRSKDFIEANKGVDSSFEELFKRSAAVSEAAGKVSAALLANPKTVHAGRMFADLSKAVLICIDKGKEFQETYKSEDKDDEGDKLSYAPYFFRSIAKIEANALQIWGVFSQEISALCRDLVLFMEILKAAGLPSDEEPEAQYFAIMGHQNRLSACLDFFTLMGFTCVGFNGPLMRIPENQLSQGVPPGMKAYKEPVLQHFLDVSFKWTDQDIRNLIFNRCARPECRRAVGEVNQANNGPITALLKCSGCKQVQYCCAECQKSHWKQHKGPCKDFQKENPEQKE